MTEIRLITSGIDKHKHQLGDIFVPLVTSKLSDESYQGAWSRDRNPIILFADHNLDGTTMSHHGGTVAGTPGGVPVQLLFWGSWWQGAGAASRANIQAQTQRLLASRYFAELTQYGIPHAPVWRGSMIVTKPAPPASGDARQTMRATLDLIDDLLDDDVFPDPDDGPRIAFLVLLPDPFRFVSGPNDGALGAHGRDYDFDGPFDTDMFWAGWVRHLDPIGGAPDNTVETLAHELIEIITDPEFDGWHTERRTGTNELVDAGGSPAPGQAPWTARSTDQTAYTNDVRVQAYWSNAHGRTVIPLLDVYRARLRATIHETARRPGKRGTFRPEGGMASCIEDRDYRWQTFDLDERVTVRADTEGFHTASVTGWTVNGMAVTGSSGNLSLPTTVTEYIGLETVERAATVQVAYRVTARGIDLDIRSVSGGFELQVACTVTDADITGNVHSQPTSRPSVQVGVRGVDLDIDPAYTEQYERCLGEMLRKYLDVYQPMGRPRPGEPPVFDMGMLRDHQPIFTPQAEWLRAKDVARGISAAYALLDAEEARSYTAGLLKGLPSIGSALTVEQIERSLQEQLPRGGRLGRDLIGEKLRRRRPDLDRPDPGRPEPDRPERDRPR